MIARGRSGDTLVLRLDALPDIGLSCETHTLAAAPLVVDEILLGTLLQAAGVGAHHGGHRVLGPAVRTFPAVRGGFHGCVELGEALF